MNLFRFFFLAAAGWLGWILLRRWLHGQGRTPSNHTQPPSPPLHMVRCAHCGIHLPQQDALEKKHRWYCGRPHLEADRPNHRDDT
ncbi:conserved hypothetical protein [Gammaproteobacteria bacterium]